MTTTDYSITPRAKTSGQSRTGLRSGDGALLGILASDFFGAVAGALVYMTMVWWVLAQNASELALTMLVLCIFIPLNLGVLVSGAAVAKFGARRLLLVSKSMALLGALVCLLLLFTETMTVPYLALLAAFVYGAMGPSITADVSRGPALVRLAQRRLAGFNATNGVVMVLGQVSGLFVGGALAQWSGPSFAVALGAVLVGVSGLITWASFPRDRVLPDQPGFGYGQMVTLSRGVMARLGGKNTGLAAILITVGYVMASEGYSEVLLPLALRADGLPPTALSIALGIAVATSIAALILAQALHEKVTLTTALAVIGALLVPLLGLASLLGGWSAVVIAVAATTAAASASATMAFTHLQEAMPASLQAQASGLWQSLVLTTSSAVIFLTGAFAAYGFAFLASIALVAVGCALWRVRRAQ